MNPPKTMVNRTDKIMASLNNIASEQKIMASCPLLEVPFPNCDQRNTWELLSKAKRKVLLLQKGAARDHILIGRTH
jgi:hypothetical protein